MTKIEEQRLRGTETILRRIKRRDLKRQGLFGKRHMKDSSPSDAVKTPSDAD
jgi:hypothetical protein